MLTWRALPCPGSALLPDKRAPQLNTLSHVSFAKAYASRIGLVKDKIAGMTRGIDLGVASADYNNLPLVFAYQESLRRLSTIVIDLK